MTTLENSIIEQQPAGFSIGARLLYLLLAAVGVVLAAFVIITPFDLQTQAIDPVPVVADDRDTWIRRSVRHDVRLRPLRG
jgi:hypothetical protein